MRLFVDWNHQWVAETQSEFAQLTFWVGEEGVPSGALDVSFLANSRAENWPDDPEGVIGVWGLGLRFGSEDEAVDRWPDPGDYFWGWDAIAVAYSEFCEHNGGTSSEG